MTLITESGAPDQNSYASLEAAEAYCVLRGLWVAFPVCEMDAAAPHPLAIEPPETDTELVQQVGAGRQKEIALIRAFDWLNTLEWLGDPFDWQGQAAWPRKNVSLPGSGGPDPEFLPEDVTPQAVIYAQIEMAGLIFNGLDPLKPVERGGKILSESHSRTEGGVDVIGGDSQSDSYAYAEAAPCGVYYPQVLARLEPYLARVPGKSSGQRLAEAFRG